MTGLLLPVPIDLASAAGELRIPDLPPSPLAFVRIDKDSSVTVIVKHLDKGQGIATGLASIVAEELDADWSQVKTEFAPANAAVYRNFYFGDNPVQGTGVSSGILNSWTQYRKAGAAARAMLVEAAARQWDVRASEVTVVRGRVLHRRSKRSAGFGDLAEAAAKLPVPQQVTLKDPKEFRIVGKRAPRLDRVGKTTGATKFAIDVRRPGMLVAVMLRPPRFGGTVKSVDAVAAKAVAGVVDVVTVPRGVAVVAKDTWAAIQGRNELKVQWDDSAAEMRSSAQILADYKAALTTPGLVAKASGDAAAALSKAAKVIEATTTFPYLAHAPIEPLNCVIEMNADGGCTIWSGSQIQTLDQYAASGVLGIKPDMVRIETTWAGGSFGRRSSIGSELVSEASSILKATGGKAPIQLVWTRQDDLAGGQYRSMFAHNIRAGLDADGKLVAWHHRMVGQSIGEGTPFETVLAPKGVDETSVEGGTTHPYAIPDMLVESINAKSKITVLWWRSVGHTHNTYAVETMMDEVAAAAGKDPLDFRLQLMGQSPRHAGVLELVAAKAGWGKKLPKGRGRGLAVFGGYGSYVAHAAEVTVIDGKMRIDRLVCAVDCGIAVNPDNVVSQMQGGAAFGLGAAMRSAITFRNGLVQEANFDTYEALKYSEMPPIEVYIVPSKENPGGIGEPGVPTVAPAIANAYFAATGKPLYDLPFGKQVGWA